MEKQSDFEKAPVSQADKLTTIEITTENMALNVLVSFVNVAQRRGAFSIDESAKIHECILKFQQKP
jgi:hypothetical protein